jgi:hypothetical protein
MNLLDLVDKFSLGNSTTSILHLIFIRLKMLSYLHLLVKWFDKYF